MTESELLFTEVLNCDRVSLYLNRNTPLGKDNSKLIASALERRINGEPVQYILGKTEFLGLEFKVDKNVFIPRPETEILVETAIKYAAGPDILDLGTGSGCIAVSLAKLLLEAQITATDISREALKIAKYNARINNVADKITFLESNLFKSLAIGNRRYALCVSNPPYIPSAEIDRLAPEVKYEPHLALDAGKDGLDFYRNIVFSAPAYLRKDGFLIMEMGFGQRQAIENIFKSSGNFEIIDIVKDYSSIDRVIVAQRIGAGWTN